MAKNTLSSNGAAEDSSLVWMVSLNGFIIDARSLPREIQEEAVDKGLIPYLPDEETSWENL